MSNFDHIHQFWAIVDGKTHWWRSAWEWRIAHVLTQMKKEAKIWDFFYEPETYTLHGVKKGEAKSYTPDFQIWTSSTSFHYWEIKGKYSARDKRRMENFKKQYPQYYVEIIREKKYKQLIEQYSKYIPTTLPI